MALQALKEIFTPRERTIPFRVGSVQPPIEIPESTWRFHLMPHPHKNIERARKTGIRPVNYLLLRTQFSQRQLSESVLFDTPPDGFQNGNHWRVLSVDDEHHTVTVQMCGNFGNYDIQIPPVTVSQEDILFTGVATMNYVRNQQRMTLNEVVEAYKDFNISNPEELRGVRYIGETIYFADKNGALLPFDKHPLFNPKPTS